MTVELLDDVEEEGLRAGTIGTVVVLPADPRKLVVEFDDRADVEPVQVTIRMDQVRLAAESK